MSLKKSRKSQDYKGPKSLYVEAEKSSHLKAHDNLKSPPSFNLSKLHKKYGLASLNVHQLRNLLTKIVFLSQMTGIQIQGLRYKKGGAGFEKIPAHEYGEKLKNIANEKSMLQCRFGTGKDRMVVLEENGTFYIYLLGDVGPH